VLCLKIEGLKNILCGKPTPDLQSVTCHMGSHSVSYHLTHANMPHYNHSQIVRYLIFLPQRDRRLSCPWWLIIYWDGLFVHRQSLIVVVTTWPAVEPTTCWSWVKP